MTLFSFSGKPACVFHVSMKNKKMSHHRSFFQTKALRDEEYLQESLSLASTLGLCVLHQGICSLSRRHPATLLTQGWLDKILCVVQEKSPGVIFFNTHLSFVQQRNLEQALGCVVIDRTALILEIFAQRARTAEGILQVKLARLMYQKSRLVRSWTHLERQKGRLSFVGGPGELQLELDRRMIEERIEFFQEKLCHVVRTRFVQRKRRHQNNTPLVVLVGYTNAGKSTLFNRIARDNLFCHSQLFSTLDPTIRNVRLPSGCVITLLDTVGFIRDLPTSVVAAFRATLEEVLHAHCLVHVRDVSSPHHRAQAHDVYQVLKDIGFEKKVPGCPVVEVFNKIDAVSSGPNPSFSYATPRSTPCATSVQGPAADPIHLSGLTGENCHLLLQQLDALVGDPLITVRLKIPFRLDHLLPQIYSKGLVLTQRMTASHFFLVAKGTRKTLSYWRAFSVSVRCLSPF